MKINGMVATHIGLVGFISPWDGDEFDIFDDIWGTPDGKRYVERYLQEDIVQYDWMKHGFIWRDEDRYKVSQGEKVFTIPKRQTEEKFFCPCAFCPDIGDIQKCRACDIPNEHGVVFL